MFDVVLMLLCLSIKGSGKRGVVSFLKNLVSSSCAMTMRCRTHYFTGVCVEVGEELWLFFVLCVTSVRAFVKVLLETYPKPRLRSILDTEKPLPKQYLIGDWLV